MNNTAKLSLLAIPILALSLLSASCSQASASTLAREAITQCLPETKWELEGDSNWFTRKLRISGNPHLNALPACLTELDGHIQHLAITDNPTLLKLPDHIEGMDLYSLQIGDNSRLQNLPRISSNNETNALSGLREYHIYRNNSLRSLPDSLCEHRLEVLAIESNLDLSSLPECLGDMPYLRRLVIRKNDSLLKIPDSICRLNVRELAILDNPRLSALPECLGDMRYVVELFVSDNAPTATLPHSVCKMPRLFFLSTPDMPGCITELPSLTFLVSDWDGDAESVPDGIGDMPNLEVFSLTPTYLDRPISICRLAGSPEATFTKAIWQKLDC